MMEVHDDKFHDNFSYIANPGHGEDMLITGEEKGPTFQEQVKVW